MNKKFFIIPLLLTVTLLARSEHEDQMEKLKEELESARNIYRTEQARLQNVTDRRWSQRQIQVDKKTLLQQDADKVQNNIERLYSQMGRIREENIIYENTQSDLEEELSKEKDKYKWIEKTLESILQREEDAVRRGMPVGQQDRSLNLQKVSKAGKSNGGIVNSRLKMLQAYFFNVLDHSGEIHLKRETIMMPDNSSEEVLCSRMGNVFAIGINDTGSCYYLGRVGEGSANPFQWVSLTDENASSLYSKKIPEWMERGRIDGEIYVDVMQNKSSAELLGAVQKTFVQKLVDIINAGGIVMIPLAIIILWALILIVNRTIVFTLAHSRDNKFIDKAVEVLNKKEVEEAKRLASRSDGVLAKILNTCLDHAKWSRAVAEKAVKELLLAEVPVLDKHLDSLAVIAGAAPLLGLLGTVTGMISMFESITRFGTGDPKLLAGGISEALVTTEVGLAIAIPVLLVHNFLRNRRNHIQADMEMYAIRILNRIWPEE